MTQLHAFADLMRLVQYNQPAQNDFFDTMASIGLDEDSGAIESYDLESTLEVMETVKLVKDMLDAQYKRMAALIICQIAEQPKGVEMPSGGKFKAIEKAQYRYADNPLWVEAKNSEDMQADYRKQLEETLRKGGFFGGQKLERVPGTTVQELRYDKSKELITS